MLNLQPRIPIPNDLSQHISNLFSRRPHLQKKSETYISMKKKFSGRSASMINSTVPAPTYPTAFAAFLALSPNSSRNAFDNPGAGASSIIF